MALDYYYLVYEYRATEDIDRMLENLFSLLKSSRSSSFHCNGESHAILREFLYNGKFLVIGFLEEIYDPKPQIANNIATTFTPSILSWKNTTARLGTIGKPKVLITLENKEDTLKISPTQPIEKTCHAIAIHTNVITYDTLPSSKTSISFLYVFHSLLAKSPTKIAQVATTDW
ncbi:hypothetical protein RJ639_015783 [Escallonia herrerae]|uniref:Uncharacterized protein n=1 Tax=Escallonia herrerae TaxID=1293975 RepID=A0AA88VFW7_9ASTE|nr:hypothetical protein RJ639_015783 [Escallonia herrerae]